MSKLAQAGDKRTASPDCTTAAAFATASGNDVANSTVQAPLILAAISCASRPNNTACRTCFATDCRNGEKSAPLPSPPASHTSLPLMLLPNPSMAASAAPTLVPLESLYQSTPSLLATHWQRCDKPGNSRNTGSTVR